MCPICPEVFITRSENQSFLSSGVENQFVDFSTNDEVAISSVGIDTAPPATLTWNRWSVFKVGSLKLLKVTTWSSPTLVEKVRFKPFHRWS